MKEIPIKGKEIQIASLESLIVGAENKAETIRFVLGKTYESEMDLSQFAFYLQFRNKEGEGEPVLLGMVTDGDKLYLSWQPGSSFTQVSGRCRIQIYALKVSGAETLRWSTKPNYIYVSEDINPDPITDLGPTVLIQYLSQYQALADESEGYKDAAASSASAAAASADTAASAKTQALSYKTQAQTAKTAAETAQSNAEASAALAAQKADAASASAASSASEADDAAAKALEAKGYRDEAMAISGVGNHVTDAMPHQFAVGGVSYKYGFRMTASGKMQYIYEEVS